MGIGSTPKIFRRSVGQLVSRSVGQSVSQSVIETFKGFKILDLVDFWSCLYLIPLNRVAVIAYCCYELKVRVPLYVPARIKNLDPYTPSSDVDKIVFNFCLLSLNLKYLAKTVEL